VQRDVGGRAAAADAAAWQVRRRDPHPVVVAVRVVVGAQRTACFRIQPASLEGHSFCFCFQLPCQPETSNRVEIDTGIPVLQITPWSVCARRSPQARSAFRDEHEAMRGRKSTPRRENVNENWHASKHTNLTVRCSQSPSCAPTLLPKTGYGPASTAVTRLSDQAFRFSSFRLMRRTVYSKKATPTTATIILS